MKSVIERLDDIENTARSIVAKAEEDKSQVEQEIQAQRDQFDKELDEKTQAELTRIREDGKRQGMSGSPILQNGKLIGAVTHVFVNNPTKGYGIFAESMINESE